MPETFRTLYADPGEDFGWCIGREFKLLAAGTTKMWEMTDEIWAAILNPNDETASILNGDLFTREDVSAEENLGPIGRIVCEDWRLYPDPDRPGKLVVPPWDQCRTARVIGALQFICRLHRIPFVLQPAAIKQFAETAGAQELYYRPLHENRHQNDAIQHFVYFTNVELRQAGRKIVGNFAEGQGPGTEDWEAKA